MRGVGFRHRRRHRDQQTRTCGGPTGLNALGGGAVNLRTSEIELHFKTAKRKGVGLNLLGIADKFVYITGTLHIRALR